MSRAQPCDPQRVRPGGWHRSKGGVFGVQADCSRGIESSGGAGHVHACDRLRSPRLRAGKGRISPAAAMLPASPDVAYHDEVDLEHEFPMQDGSPSEFGMEAEAVDRMGVDVVRSGGIGKPLACRPR